MKERKTPIELLYKRPSREYGTVAVVRNLNYPPPSWADCSWDSGANKKRRSSKHVYDIVLCVYDLLSLMAVGKGVDCRHIRI